MTRLAAPLFGLTLLAACTDPAGRAAHADPAGERRPVVVELFSSEGCSSCPPADVVLDELARTQPVAGAEVVALELHVDYWNALGWADPFSSPVYSARQRTYADAMGRSGVYTPQMVVDGRAELVGSRGDAARKAIAEAAKEPKATIRLAKRDGEAISISIGALPGGAEGDVWLAVTESNLKTAVPRGENAGATLAHGPVVRELKKIGVARASGFEGEIAVPLGRVTKREQARAVVFVQRSKTLQIAGAASIALR